MAEARNARCKTLSQIKSGHIDGAVRPGSDDRECVRLSRRRVISARPCSMTNGCACRFHFLRIDPISRSAYAFCQGERCRTISNTDGPKPDRAVSNTDGSNPADEYLAVGAIAVPDQVMRDLFPATRLFSGIGDPFGRWMRARGIYIAAPLLGGVRCLFLFEMQESIGRLDVIGLDTRWEEFRNLLKSFDSQRMAAVQEMTQMSKAILSGPAPGVNHGAMTARAPELTAQVEQIDKSMFTMSQPLFLALVDEGRVEADGNLHHFILNKKDRADLVHTIDIAFGRSLDDKDVATSIVNAAWAIKYGLTRPIYKAADEP